MNYIYGTWSVLCALNAAGVDPHAPDDAQGGRLARRDPERGRRLGRGRRELQARLPRLRAGAEHRLADGMGAAWPDGGGRSRSSGCRDAASTISPTTQGDDGFWDEQRYTATGFPRVFYLRYHGYPKFFPLWAMARYRNLKSGNTQRRVRAGCSVIPGTRVSLGGRVQITRRLRDGSPSALSASFGVGLDQRTGDALLRRACGRVVCRLGGCRSPSRLSRALRWRGSPTSRSCTWLSNTYCAGRWLASEISGAIGPSVRTPRSATCSALSGCCKHRFGGGRLVAAMRHAVRALFVAAGAVGIPVGGLHQLLEGLGVAFAEQIAGLLPAEDVARRHAPRRAVEFLIAGEEVEEHAGMR